MRDGRILQVDAPQRLYEQPRDLFVAGFIGSPAMNLVEATIDGDEVRVRPVPRSARPDPPSRRDGSPSASCSGSGRRASRTRRSRSREPAARSTSRWSCVEELGSDAHVFFRVDAPRITPEAIEAEGEDDAQLVADETRCSPRASTRGRPRASARSLRLAVDPARFHFFDPETGASLLEHAQPPWPSPSRSVD